MAVPAFEVLSASGGGVPAAAEQPYGGPLEFPERPRPYVAVNFVATIDGVASLGISDGTELDEDQRKLARRSLPHGPVARVRGRAAHRGRESACDTRSPVDTRGGRRR